MARTLNLAARVLMLQRFIDRLTQSMSLGLNGRWERWWFVEPGGIHFFPFCLYFILCKHESIDGKDFLNCFIGALLALESTGLVLLVRHLKNTPLGEVLNNFKIDMGHAATFSVWSATTSSSFLGYDSLAS